MSNLLSWFRGGSKPAPAPVVAPGPKRVVHSPKKALDLLVTLWPSFDHFPRFVRDPNVSGIRLNSAMLSNPELDKELEVIRELGVLDQLYFDVKARQPRVVEVIPNRRYLDLRLNHPVEVRCPSTVLFKGGVDQAVLDHLEEDGRRLIFKGGPEYAVKPGESLYLRDPNLRIKGDLFIPEEIRKIEKCRAAGFKKWFLSYVEEESDIDQFLELAGQDAEVWLKIESMRGLQFVAERFKKRENLVLVAARGDLYVEIDRPDQMAKALRLIIEKDPEACAASRLLLSVVEKAGGTKTLWKYKGDRGEEFFLWNEEQPQPPVSPITGRPVTTPPVKTRFCEQKTTLNPVPSCADFLELQWLYDIGYRRMMLCDELCLRGDLLGTAVNAFNGFRTSV